MTSTNEKRLKEVLNEKIESYHRNPNKHKRDELEQKWGLDGDIIDGYDAGEQPLNNNEE